MKEEGFLVRSGGVEKKGLEDFGRCREGHCEVGL